MAITLHVCGSLNIENKRKLKKNAISIYKISSFSI
jgi:hypothetical protein